jgi:hypothetical protein
VSTASDAEKVTRLLPSDRFWSTSEKFSFFLERLYVAASNMPLWARYHMSVAPFTLKKSAARSKSRKCKRAQTVKNSGGLL